MTKDAQIYGLETTLNAAEGHIALLTRERDEFEQEANEQEARAKGLEVALRQLHITLTCNGLPIVNDALNSEASE